MDQLAAEIYADLKNRKPSIDVLSYGFNNESPADREQLLMVYTTRLLMTIQNFIMCDRI